MLLLHLFVMQIMLHYMDFCISAKSLRRVDETIETNTLKSGYEKQTLSCKLEIDPEELQNKRAEMTRIMSESDVNLIYIHLTIKGHPSIKFESRELKNRIREWQYVNKNEKFLVQLPVDIDLVTFSILARSGEEKAITIPMKTQNANMNCTYTETTVQYIKSNLWEELLRNFSDDYILCNRNFESVGIRTCLYWITTVWVGYDLTCTKLSTGENIDVGKFIIPNTCIIPIVCFILAIQYFWIYGFLNISNENIDLNYKRGDSPYSIKRATCKFLYWRHCTKPHSDQIVLKTTQKDDFPGSQTQASASQSKILSKDDIKTTPSLSVQDQGSTESKLDKCNPSQRGKVKNPNFTKETPVDQQTIKKTGDRKVSHPQPSSSQGPIMEEDYQKVAQAKRVLDKGRKKCRTCKCIFNQIDSPAMRLTFVLYFLILLPFSLFRTLYRWYLSNSEVHDYLTILKPSEPLCSFCKDDDTAYECDIAIAVTSTVLGAYFMFVTYEILAGKMFGITRKENENHLIDVFKNFICPSKEEPTTSKDIRNEANPDDENAIKITDVTPLLGTQRQTVCNDCGRLLGNGARFVCLPILLYVFFVVFVVIGMSCLLLLLLSLCIPFCWSLFYPILYYCKNSDNTEQLKNCCKMKCCNACNCEKLKKCCKMKCCKCPSFVCKCPTFEISKCECCELCCQKYKVQFQICKNIFELIVRSFILFMITLCFLFSQRIIISTITFLFRLMTYFIFVALPMRITFFRFFLIFVTALAYVFKYHAELVNMATEVLDEIFNVLENKKKEEKNQEEEKKKTEIVSVDDEKPTGKSVILVKSVEEETFDKVIKKLEFSYRWYVFIIKCLVLIAYIFITLEAVLNSGTLKSSRHFEQFLSFLFIAFSPAIVQMLYKTRDGYLNDEHKSIIENEVNKIYQGEIKKTCK